MPTDARQELRNTTDKIGSGVSGAFGGINDAQDWVNKNWNEPSQEFVGKLPVIGGISDMLNGRGAFSPLSTGMTDATAADANALRNAAVSDYADLKAGSAPTMRGAQLDTTLSGQSRGLAAGGLAPMTAGLGIQQTGAGIQQQGLGVQGQGIDIQRSGLGALNMGLGTQQEGLGAQRAGLGAIGTGMGTLGEAAGAYRDVLSGSKPSVAALTGQRLQGQNIASMFGGAASARGVDRAGAMRAAIYGSGAVNARGAADAAINQAREQEAARAGLLGAGGAQVGAGSAMTGTGSAMGGIGSSMGGIGQGIAGIGQGVTAGGQGISATGAGLANTGAGMVNTGTSIGNLGLGIRGQDITQANDQATLDQATGTNNLNSQLTTTGQNITQQNNLGNLALGAQKNEQDAADKALEQQRKSQGQGQDNAKGALGLVGGLIKGLF